MEAGVILESMMCARDLAAVVHKQNPVLALTQNQQEMDKIAQEVPQRAEPATLR
jgi:hypothetical protein